LEPRAQVLSVRVDQLRAWVPVHGAGVRRERSEAKDDSDVSGARIAACSTEIQPSRMTLREGRLSMRRGEANWQYDAPKHDCSECREPADCLQVGPHPCLIDAIIDFTQDND
jgi:hypothetical protein